MKIADGTALINSPEIDLSQLPVALDAATENKLEDLAVAIDMAKMAIAWQLVSIGKELKAARELFGPRDAQFIEWAKDRCGICRSRVYQAIQVFEKFGLSTRLDGFQVSAIVQLAKDDVPDEVRAEALELAEAGEQITKKKARQLIESHEQKAEPAVTTNADADDQRFARIVARKKKQQEKRWPLAALAQAEECIEFAEAIDSEANERGISASQVLDERAAAAAYKCHECGHDEADEDGDCMECHAPPPGTTNLYKYLERLRRAVDKIYQAWPSDELPALVAKLRSLAEQIEAGVRAE